MAEEQKIRPLVRIVNTDLKGTKPIGIALKQIKGVGYIFANAVLKTAHIANSKKTGLLSPDEIERINDILSNPLKYRFPVWMLNRRKDYETGNDGHLLMSELDYTQQQDVRRLQKIKSRRGMRLAVGLPVRGQRTKSNFRRNKGKAMGVKRKAGAKAGKV
ncbi:MAG: 30S ribosomal protein S13 [archaeon]